MGRKSKKTKIQLFLNKYYMPLLLVFVFGILLTAAIIDKNKKYEKLRTHRERKKEKTNRANSK